MGLHFAANTMEGKTCQESVQEYYGKVLQNSKDLNTNACSSAAAPPDDIRRALANVHSEVTSRYFGCGLTIPRDDLCGLKILDLGCGAGQDCYIAAQLVGESGEVVGVDMTQEQLDVANQYVDYHANKFGYGKPNTRFLKGFIERLEDLKLESNYFDIIISNCVINLSPDKPAVFREAYRVLKPGGELYFSDMYSDRRVPEQLAKDPVLFGEGLGGALYYNDLYRVAKHCGFLDPRLVSDYSSIIIHNKDIQERVGHINFCSATFRLWKLDHLESECEDYGQAVRYKGTLSNSPQAYLLDGSHTFVAGKMALVCGNTYAMLHDTRLAPHFEFFSPDPRVHFGIFPGCGSSNSFQKASSSSSSSCC